MNSRNIVIIAVIAILAVAAVLAIPQFLDSSDGEEREEIASNDTASDGDGGNGGHSDADDGKDDAADGPGPVQSTGPANPMLAAQLQEAARQINAGGNIRIDQFTTMTGAEASGNRIRYRYEISRELNAQQLTQFRSYAERTNQQTLCARADTRRLLQMGGEMEYVYYGPRNRYLFSTPITGC